MIAKTHAELHADHRTWKSEIALWRDELALWREECVKALAAVDQITTALREQDKALQAHGQSIDAQKEYLSGHEQALAEYEGGVTDESLIAQAKEHQHEEELQNQRREAHERIKRQHHALMAELVALLKTLARAM
jgi:hypothetical protein